MLCQTTIFLCLISSLCLLLCAWFSLIYCYAKYLHDHRWEGGFLLQFLFFLFHCQILGPIFEQQRTHLFRRLPFYGLPPFVQNMDLPEDPCCQGYQRWPVLCWGGEGFFDTLLWNTFTIKIPREYLHRVSLENTFSDSAKLPVVGFTLLSTVFRTVFISIGCSIES